MAKIQRKSDQKGIEGIEGRFERNQWDHLDRIEKSLGSISEGISNQSSLDKGFIDTLDNLENLLSANNFNSDQAYLYYQQSQNQTVLKKMMPILLKIVIALVLYIGSLILIISDLPPWLKGTTLFLISTYEGITTTDLLAIGLFFGGSLIFVKQILKIVR